LSFLRRHHHSWLPANAVFESVSEIAWSPVEDSDQLQWIQIDLEEYMDITGIAFFDLHLNFYFTR